MRRIAQFIILIVLLALSTNAQIALSQDAQRNINSASPIAEMPSPTQDLGEGEFSRPIFEGMNDTTGVASPIASLRDRNDTLGYGAIYPATAYTNVTIYYMVVNANSDTHVRLYADATYQDGNGTYSLSSSGLENESIKMTFLFTEVHNFTLPYFETGEELFNATIGYFSAELNVTSDYLRFYAKINNGVSETDGSAPYNMLTTDLYWQTESEDEFYIQDDPVLINFVGNETDPSLNYFGVRYKLETESVYQEMNFTNIGSTIDFEDQIDLGVFEINNKLEWRSFAWVNDTSRNLTRRIDGIEIKFVVIDDGTPTIETNITSESESSILRNDIFYTSVNIVNFNFSATVPKGNITQFELTLGDDNQTTIPALGNVSMQGEFYNFNHTYTGEGKFNITILARTNKDLTTNATYQVIVDVTLPSRAFSSDSVDLAITTFNGKVTFKFNYSDEGAGVRYAILDLGDGVSVEVTSSETYTHTYLIPKGTTTYQVVLTVVDWAGNTNDVLTTVTIIPGKLDTTSPPGLETILLFVLVIGGMVLYFGRNRIFKN